METLHWTLLFLMMVATCVLSQDTAPSKKKKFHVETSGPMNWFEAYQHCRAQGRQLAAILSKEENDDFVVEIGKIEVAQGNLSHTFWVAATDIANSSYWYWMTTGQPVLGFNQWLVGKPDNNRYVSDHCLTYFKHDHIWKVDDVDCYGVRYFACEFYE